MRFFFLTTRKDLTRVLRDPIGLLIWIAMPGIITAAVSLISTSPQPIPQGVMLVADQDRSVVSAAMVNTFSRPPLDKMVKVVPTDEVAGHATIDRGDASALLVVPKGFGSAVIMRQHAALGLWVNPSQRIVPTVIRQVLSGMVETGFRIPQRLITIQTETVGERFQPLSLPGLFFPGMLLFGVFGLAQSMSLEWWAEKTQGTLRRMITMPRPLNGFVAGKTAALAVLIAVVGFFGMCVAKWGIGSPAKNFAVTVLWICGSGVALYLMSSLLQMIAADQRSGLVINQFVLFLLSMMGGTFFPFEMMPKWLALIGKFTPNGYAVSQFKLMTNGAIDASGIAIGFLVMIAFVAAEFWLLSYRVRKWAV